MKDKTDILEERMDRVERTLTEIKSILTGKSKIESVVSVKEHEIDEDDQRRINCIMRNFDFNKVHRVMQTLGWHWITYNKGQEVPSIDIIKKEAKRLLVDAVTEKETIATGGFRATYEKGTEEDPEPFLSLEFIVEDCEGFNEEPDEEGDNDDWVE